MFPHDDVAAYASGFCGSEQWHECIHVTQVWPKHDEAAGLDGSGHGQPDGESTSHRESTQDDAFKINWIIVQECFVVLLNFIPGCVPVVVPDKGVDSGDL